MKKKVFLGLIVVVALIYGANDLYKRYVDSTSVSTDMLDYYFVKNNVPLSNAPNYFIINDQEEMDSIFGIAKTMTNRIEPIDFTKETVIAIALSSRNVATEIEINSIRIIDNNLYVDYQINTGDFLSYNMVPLTVVKFEMPSAMDLYFTEKGIEKERIALGRRSLQSPRSTEELEENFTGTFGGTLPCADCSGISTQLTLNKNHTYTLAQTYLGKNEAPVVQEGQWVAGEDLSLVKLMESDLYYYLYDSNTLELMSPDMKRINSELNYKLIRR